MRDNEKEKSYERQREVERRVGDKEEEREEL